MNQGVEPDLHHRLGGPPPDAIAALGPDALAQLDALVADAEHQQLVELAAALDNALRIVPKPLRPVIRKVVGVR